MLKQRRMIAEQVAAALFEAETAIDAAITKTAMLARHHALAAQGSRRPRPDRPGRRRTRQPDHHGAGRRSRRQIVETHKELSIAQGQIGLGAVTMTDPIGGDKPTLSLPQERTRPLRVA